VVAIVALLAPPAAAGDLSVTGAGPLPSEQRIVDPRFPCTHVFSGPFEAGDAQKIIDAAPSLLCLDSPGGSLSEALTLTAWMKDNALATKVTAKARCLSACALVFMAGSAWPVEGRSAFFWRVLEPGGRLGSHAPSLTVPDGNYTQSTVAEAYNVSTRAISRIIADLAMRSDLTGQALSLSLLGQMLATPPASMLVIDSVDQAGRWDIAVPAAKGAWPPSPEDLSRICVNAQAWANDLSAVQDWLPVFTRHDSEETATAFKGFVLLNEISSDGCLMTVDKAGAPHFLFMEMTYEGTVFYDRLMRYDARMPLSDVPLDTSDVHAGLCIVKKDGGPEIDRQRCRETRVLQDGVVVRTYAWPSGARTVVEERPDFQTSINGVATYAQDLGTQICWNNSNTGNTFCFERG